MRIMQVCTSFLPGGIQRHVLDLAEHLRAEGHSVVLAGDGGDWAPTDDPENYIPLALKQVAASGGSIFKRISEVLPVARKLREAVRKNKIQIIHAHESAPAIVARLAVYGLNIPVVLTYHGSEPDREASFARTAKRCADRTLSPSRTALDALIGHGLPKETTEVIGLGVHELREVSASEVAKLRAELLGDKGKILISSLSRLAQQKGIDMMIEVARKVAAHRNDVVIAVGGHGPLEDLVENWAEIAQVADRIKFLGPVSDVAPLLAASDFYLLTSRWEALPISIVEAFRSSLPVVATDCGGVHELVNSEVGAVLPVGDTNAIAQSVLELAENEELRKTLGENALALSREARFNPDAVHTNFEKLYQRMISEA